MCVMAMRSWIGGKSREKLIDGFLSNSEGVIAARPAPIDRHFELDQNMGNDGNDEEDTEIKLAILSSIFTGASPESLFDVLIKADGSVKRAIDLHLDSAKR